MKKVELKDLKEGDIVKVIYTHDGDDDYYIEMFVKYIKGVGYYSRIFDIESKFGKPNLWVCPSYYTFYSLDEEDVLELVGDML